MYLDVAVIKSNLILFIFILFFFSNRREKTTEGKTKQERGRDGACLVIVPNFWITKLSLYLVQCES